MVAANDEVGGDEVVFRIVREVFGWNEAFAALGIIGIAP